MRDDILKPSGVPRVEPHPPIKSQPRPTYFSELFSSAAKAAEAHERRQQVDNVMSIRSIPEIVQVSDYTTGGQYQRQISIKNFSRKIRRVRIEPPKTKYFNLCKSVRTDEISIAPGMQYVFYIEFNAPTQVSLNKSNRGVVSASVSGLLEIGHSLLNIHQQQILAANTYLPDLEDCVGVLMEDGSIFEIPVTATPVKPSLAIPSHVDFGTLFTSKFNQGDFDMELLDDEEWDIKSSSVDSSSIHESVIVKHVKIRNDGTKRAKFDAIYDKSLPIRISPSSVILDPAGTIFNGVETDSCDLKIAIKPIKAGKFKYDVHFDVNGGKSNEKAVAAIEASIINDAGRRRGTKLMNNGGGLLLPTSSQFKMSLVGNVLDHKIRIRDAKNSKDIDPQNLFFGSIYFGEMSLMTVRLHNRAPKPINWVISHAGQSRPYVPGQSKDLDTTDALMKAAVSVFPSEGTLPPDETSIVTFKFAPTIHAQSKGFKVSSHPPEISNYKVPMQLNLLAANGQAVYGEEPIDFTLTGETCPLIVSVSKNEITFPSTTLGKSSEKTLELKNGSDRLGLQFDFKKIANIVITPMHGRLAPFQMATIKVVYHPNQIGPLKSSLECKISSLASKECLPEEIINLREREGFSIDSASAKIMHIDLLGECSIDVNTRVTTHGVLVKPSGKQWSSSNASGRKASSRKSFENSKSLTLFLGSTPMSDSDKQVNPEWEAKSDNRDRFINYIRTSHADKVSQERIKKFGKDGVEIDYSKVSLHKHYHLVDSHNGLPEPNVEDNNATDKAARDLIVHPHKFGDAIVESHRPVRDDRKLKDLIEKLFEPVVHKAKASVFSTSFGAAITTGHGEGGAATAGERVNATTTTTTGGTGSTTNGMSPLSLSSPSATPDSPLTGTDLANFFASKSSIDVGTVTTHSVTRVPVNFLNATPSRHPIHISFLTHKKSGQSVHVSPKSIIVPAMSLVGVEVQIQSHQAGPLSQDITYLLNGRYKYQIHVTANVAPIHLNLDKQGVNIQLNYQLESAEEKIMPKSLAELIRPDTADSQQEHSGGFIKPKSSITLRNEGNYPASFIWSLDGEKPDTAEMSVDEAAATSNGAVVRRISTIAATSGLKSSVKKYVTEIGQDGLIEVVPKQGRILPNSELKVNFYFTPGVKPTHEESMSLHIIDNFDSNSSSIIETINVNCKAEIPGAYCSLLTSVKHGYLDMGRIQMGYANPFISSGWIDISGSSTSVPADVFSFKRMTSGGGATHLTTALWNYNVFSSSAFSHKDPIGTTKSQQQGLKVIKVKNGSQNACYFTAKTVAENSELQLSTENGFIAGNGGILDLVVSCIPTKPGPVEDAVLINIAGAGKSLRIPIRYDGHHPDVLFAEGSSEIETSTVVGSSCSKNFSIQNIKDFAVRAVIDLREFPELDIKLNTVVVEVTGLGFRKQHGLASRRASTIGGASLGLPQHQLLPQQQPRSSSSNLMVASIGSGINQRGGSSSNLLVANNSMTPAIAPRPQTVRALDKNEIAKKNSRISLIKPGDELYRFEVKAAENAFMRLSNSGARKEEWLMSNTDFPNLFTANEKYSSGGVGGGNIFIIDVNPDECMDLQLVFKPRQVKQYSLDIPVRCLGGNINHILHLETNAISSPITLSKNAIDFQNRVLVKDFNAMMNGEDAKEIVHIENKSGTTMKWSFDTAVIEQRGNVFRIEPTQGTLFPDQTQALCVFFKPDNTGPVSSEVHLYVESLGFKSPVSLQLKGTGVEPSLAFDPPEIILPFIPAGGEITSVFSIVNYGCDRTEIRFNIPQEPLSKYGNLELSFPEGRLLKGDGEKLAVIVKYTSNVKDAGGAKDIKNNSTSFAIKVEFLNQISQTFYLPIRGTSDSSLLTLQPYLWSNRQTHSFSLSEDSRFIHYQPIVPLTEVAEKDKRTKIISGPRPFKSWSGLSLDTAEDVKEAKIFYTNIGVTIMRCLEDHINMPYELGEFPEQFVLSDGRLFYEMVFSLSGKRLYGLVPVSATPSSKQEKVVALVKQYTECINQLQSFGALLNNIQPEYLLSDEDHALYCDYRRIQAKQEFGDYVHNEHLKHQRRIKENYDIFLKESWATMLLQVVRVFVSQTITAKSFRLLPGVDVEANDFEWQVNSKSSSIYSASDIVLLRWASYHTFKVTGVKRRYFNFSTDFGDCKAFVHLLTSHLPELESGYFGAISKEGTSDEVRVKTAKAVHAAMKSLFPGCTAIQDFPFVGLAKSAEFKELEVYLLLTLLYQSLPQFLPKSSIDFHGALHDRVTRYVEINNPTGRAVLYSYSLMQRSDFCVDQFEIVNGSGSSTPGASVTTINMPPRSTIRVPILFNSRFNRNVSDQITFRSKKIGINNVSILVFLLNGVVEKSVPKKTFKVEAPMYCTPPSVVEMDITNPFNSKGKFKISLLSVKSTPYTAQELQLPPSSGEEDVKATDEEENKKREIRNPTPFYLSADELVIGACETENISLKFVPFSYGTFEAIVHLVDDDLGEFSYRIEGRSSLPTVSENLNWTCRATGSVDKSLRINFTNILRDKAVSALGSHLIAAAAEIQQQQQHASFTTATIAENGSNDANQSINTTPMANFRELYQFSAGPLRYRVNYASQYFKGPSEITISPPKQAVLVKEKGKANNNVTADREDSELPISFNPKHPGKYSCKITMYGIDTTDVRVINIQGSVMSQGSVAELDFTTPSRTNITQDIPIINQSNDEWTVKATLQGFGFNGPLTVNVKPRSISNYPLSFCPSKSCEVKGLLLLSNLQTGQKHTYYLKGFGLDPPAQDHITLECESREKITRTFMVHNYSEQEAEFEVVTDIPNSSGSNSIKVPANQALPYELRVFALLSGISSRTIHFINKADKSFTWYSVQMHVKAPPAESSIDMSVEVRKALDFEINLVNPTTNKVLVYRVRFDGLGLKGDSTIELQPSESKKYVLKYAPMISQSSKGMIRFSNDELGEFWYELNLVAIESPPITLPEMTSPLGKSSIQTVTLVNPLNKTVEVTVNVSNKRDFGVIRSIYGVGSGSSPSSPYFDVHVSRRPTMPILLLNPYESVDLDILFSPSSITEDRSSTIQFQSSEIGHTIYHVHGRGLKPEIMPETTVTSKIGDTSTAFIAFFNPFVDPIPIDVYWETSLSMNSTTAAASGHNQDALKPRRAPIRSASESRRDDAVTTSDSSFKLVNRQGSKFHHSVNPLDYLEIPFSYTPQNMNQATSILVVEIKGQLKWTYPIKGIPEALVADASIIQPFETKVRDQFEREFSVTMEGFCDHDAAAGIGRGGNWDDVLDYSLEGPTRVKPDAKTDGLSAYKLELEDARLEDPKINRLEILFRISFKPTRHLDAVYTLVVSSRRSGGRWRWPVRVLIHPPPIDDKITIEGSIGKLSLVTFNLAVGVGGKNKPFQAYFTRESPAEFAVEPKTGIMVADKEENKFTIAYRPSVYGKTLVGTLIVETEDDSWSFEVRGVPPHYEPQRMGTASRSNSASTSSRYSSKGTLGRGDVAQQPLASPAAAKNSGKRANIIKFNALNPAVSLLKSKRL